MFTIKDICDIAVQIERNGEATYRQTAEIVGDQKIEALLNRMADEEQRHGRWFEALASNNALKTEHHQEMVDMGRALLQDMVKGQTFSLKTSELLNAENMEDLLKQSIEFEQDTVTFYEMLLEFVDDRQVRKQLDLIIEEERQHIIQLRNID